MKEKENFPEIEDDIDIDEDVFSTYCPYLKAKKYFNYFFPKDPTLDYLEDYYKNQKDKKSSKFPSLPSFHTKFSKFGLKSTSPFFSNSKKKYQFSFNNEKILEGVKKEEKKEGENEKDNDDEDDDSGDEIPQSGCPVVGKYRREPLNKNFEPHHEIPLYGPYDFLFFLKGGLSEEEWLQRTKKVRSLPRHLKYTLFYQNQQHEELLKIHKYEFPKVFFIYDELKQKGIRYYNRNKYREALEYLNYAYGLLDWIEFKDKKRQENFLKKPTLDAILDEDIEIKRCYMDSPEGQEESLKSSEVNILLIMAYCFMELRHYSSAIGCLDECEKIAGDLVPDVFFRRAQARLNNKNSNDLEMKKAKEDIDKAIKLGEKYNEDIRKEYDETSPIYSRIIDLEIYYKTREKLDEIMESKINKNIYGIRRIIGKICDKEHQNLKHEESMLLESLVLSKKEDIFRYYKVLKTMKKEYKQLIQFFCETKNTDQLNLTYYEYEKFMGVLDDFKFYYTFQIDSIDPKVINRLNQEEKDMINNQNKYDFYMKRIMHICEDIYSHGDYNIEIFQYSLEEVLDEERKIKEEEEKKQEILNPKASITDRLMSISKKNFGIYLTICFITLTIIAIGFQFLF